MSIHLSKSLGPIEEWLSRLEVTYHSGYNMIHFRPNPTTLSCIEFIIFHSTSS